MPFPEDVESDPVRTTSRRALAVTAVLATATLALTACTAAPAGPGPATSTAARPTTAASGTTEPTRDVGVQLFQWTWDAIAAECTDVLGPAGYGWVLTSPPQEHILGEQWWTAYQPVSHRIESRLGTREEFAAMVRACDAVGVEVIADAVVNHMTGQDTPGTGWAGSPYEHYEYPGLYSDANGDFHHCDLNPTDDILRYDDAREVQTCELVNLADLATGTDHVRATIVAYLQDLLSLGVAGFRIDAAKHVPAQDIAAIVAELPAGTRIAQEVIGAAGEPIQPADYLAGGDVFDFGYGRELAGYVGGGSVGNVLGLGTGTAALPSDQALVFVDNHDTERNGSTFMYRDGADYALATVLMLAGDYGTPVVYSGYSFRSRDAGPAQDADGAVLDASCGPDVGPQATFDERAWVCQHRWPAIAGMVGWRGAVGDAEVTDVFTDRRVVAFGRGDRGFIAANGGTSDAEHTIATSLPPGTYCDVITGGLVDGACTGRAVPVRPDGTVTLVVPGDGAVALHVGARSSG